MIFFEFIIIAKDKFHKDQFTCTITNKDGVETTTTVSVRDSLFKELGPINLRDGEKIVIHGLSLGDYTVKETHVIGYKTTVEAVETKVKLVPSHACIHILPPVYVNPSAEICYFAVISTPILEAIGTE